MAKIDLRPGHRAIPASCMKKCDSITKRVDFSANNADANDTVQLLDLAANVEILAAHIVVHTAEGGTGTVDLGFATDGTTDETLMAAGNVNSEGTLLGDGANGDDDGGTYAGLYPQLLTTDTQLVLTANNALDTAVIDVVLTVVDHNTPSS